MVSAPKALLFVATSLGLLVGLSDNTSASRDNTIYNEPTTVQGATLAGAAWTPTGALQHPRALGETMTLLPSGNVLVVGGAGATVDVSGTAETYDAVSGRWSLTGPLLEPVAQHTATLLPSGRVLVLGQSPIDNEPAIPQLYDPATGTWSPTGRPTTPTIDHTATLLPSGKVLLAGGFRLGQYFDTAELYDPATGTWSPTGSLASSRGGHRAVLLRSGRVLVVGGFSGPFITPGQPFPIYSLLGSVEIYNPATGIWSPTASPSPFELFSLTMLQSGRVLLVRSSGPSANAELYDEATGMWSVTGATSTVREGHTATLLPSGRVLVAGGSGAIQPGSIMFDEFASAELYDPVTGEWQETAPMMGKRAYHAAVLLRTGAVLVAGGYASILPEGLIAPAELYDEGAGACGENISAQVEVFPYSPYTVATFFRFQYVFVHNKSALPIAGPIALVMDNLQRAAFIGGSLRTGCFGGEDPYTIMSVGADDVLSPNEVRVQGLWFLKTQVGPLDYSPIVARGLPLE